MAAIERFMVDAAKDSALPELPKSIVLFQEGKMVWLSNAQDFSDFTEQVFEAYEKQQRLQRDIAEWQLACDRLTTLTGTERDDALINAWYLTEFAEFSLYGARTVLIKRLDRFDEKTRQEIWSIFATPGKLSFLTRLDNELIESGDPRILAERYPWVDDGYRGVANTAYEHFLKRQKIVGDKLVPIPDLAARRLELADQLGLSRTEIDALALARELSQFMDERKAWMMQTRRLITHNLGPIEFGWCFNDGQAGVIEENDTQELWRRYIDFQAAGSVLNGIVASKGGHHFVSGEVVVITDPTEQIPSDKILVVPATSPSYVPHMRSARALVTDHGGMMSHAAIVAREFNLPCIVGTKQGTKVLKNGDKVVLDLVRGEINK